MRSAIVLLNPRSRSGGRVRVDRLLAPFRDAGWQCEVWVGDGLGWTSEAAQRAVAMGADAVFGAGGDGLLSEILPAVIGTEVALGVIPLGTGNVWARELKLPLDARQAIVEQLQAPPRRVDVGVANGRPFLVIASAGLDARIVERVETDRGTKSLGQVGYPLAGLALAAGMHGTPCRLFVDDEAPRELDLLAGIITNGRLYGGVVELVADARVDDGLLDLACFSGVTALDATAHAARVLVGMHHLDPLVVMRRVRQVRIESLASPMAVQSDGDPRGTTPLEIEVLPSALLALGAR